MRGYGVAFGVWLAAGVAQAQPPPVEVTVLQHVQLPWQQPEVIVHARSAVSGLRVQATCADGETRVEERAALEAGKSHSLMWRAEAGTLACAVEVSGQAAGDAPFHLRQQASIDVTPALQAELLAGEVDLDARSLWISLDRPGAFAELALFALDGRELHRSAQSVEKEGAKADARMQLRWPELPEPVARIEVRAFARDHSWAELAWEPIQIELPHEPIYFDDAGWALARAERAKLDGVLRELERHAKQHRAAKGLGVYVLAVHGQVRPKALMERRAGSVARYFKQRGLRLPLYIGTVEEPGRREEELLPIVASHPPAQTSWRRVR